MRRIIVAVHLTLDGVLQSPGRAEEDTRGGFDHGGWAAPRADPTGGESLRKALAGATGFLLGRRTYEDFAGFWPKQTDGNPFTKALNDGQKYVASRTLTEPLPWQNSTLLPGDAADAVADLKDQEAGDLAVFGSSELVRSLMHRELIDEYVLMIHPLVLGSGRRLFTDGVPCSNLRLIDSVTSPSGVVIATYQPATATCRRPTTGGHP
jgi:dihydrofolate reductase